MRNLLVALPKIPVSLLHGGSLINEHTKCPTAQSKELCQDMTEVFFSGNYGLQSLLCSLIQSYFNHFYFLHEIGQILFVVAITTGRNLTILVKIP